MKKYYTILLLLNLSNAFGQTGVPFAPNYSHWSQLKSFWYYPNQGLPWECVCYYSQFQIREDTIIGNKYMQKLFRSSYQKFDSVCIDFYAFLYYDQHRVYLGKDTSTLTLLYDFNLTVGDSFTFNALINTPYPNTFTLAVSSVDMINLGGKLRKRITFPPIPFYASLQDPIQWVEGIGDYTYGWNVDYGFIVFANYVNSGTCALTCFTDNNKTTFGTCTYSNCIVGVSEIPENENVLIYPNPIDDILNIITNREYQTEIIIRDITSRKFIQQTFTNGISLLTNKLAKGIYIYELRNKDYVMKKGKLVKQ